MKGYRTPTQTSKLRRQDCIDNIINVHPRKRTLEGVPRPRQTKKEKVVAFLTKSDVNGDPRWVVWLFVFAFANLFYEGLLPFIPFYFLGWL